MVCGYAQKRGGESSVSRRARFQNHQRRSGAHQFGAGFGERHHPGPVEYLAYFGHSWSSPGVGSWLFIGETASAGSNLSAVRSDTEAPVTDIPKNKFVPGAQIRLFGCRAGYGPASIAAELHNDLGVTVFAYENSGGSLFTQDAALGHGQRAVTRADINLTKFETAAKTWLVPINGIPTFRRF